MLTHTHAHSHFSLPLRNKPCLLSVTKLSTHSHACGSGTFFPHPPDILEEAVSAGFKESFSLFLCPHCLQKPPFL